MIKSMTVENYLGEKMTVVLNEAYPETGLMIKSIDGLGPMKANINVTDLATTDGSRFNSSRFDKRNIVITFILSESLPSDETSPKKYSIENSRQRLYKYFPGKRPVTVSFLTDNRDARIVGYVESNEPEIFSEEETVQVSLICPDPYFYSNEPGFSPHTIEFSGLEGEFTFPFSNESLTENLLKFGEITPIVEKYFSYFGDQETGVRMNIHIVHEINTNIRIEKRLSTDTNTVVGYFLLDIDKIQALFGTNFLPGDDIIIDTVNGNKKIILNRNATKYNILNAVSRDSDWFQLNKGTNTFYITAYGNEQYLLFNIENYVIYEGI